MALRRQWRSASQALALSLALSLALAFASPALAHGSSIPHDLAGVRLCVDAHSIDVRFERGGVAAERAVTERLERALETIFTAGNVDWWLAGDCPAEDGYLSLVLDVREATWFAPRASAYALAVQVGRRAPQADGSVRAAPADGFDLAVHELFDERAVGIPALVFLPGYLEAALRDLTVSWWEDQLATASDARLLQRWLPPVGAVLASLTGWLTWRALRARR